MVNETQYSLYPLTRWEESERNQSVGIEYKKTTASC